MHAYRSPGEIEVYALTAAIVFLGVVSMHLFSRTPAGRMANAVRDNPERVEFLVYSQRHVHFISFCASGFFAGVVGAVTLALLQTVIGNHTEIWRLYLGILFCSPSTTRLAA